MAAARVFVFWGQSNNRSAGVTGAVLEVYQTPDPGVFIWNIDTQAIEVYEAGVNSDTINVGSIKWGPEAEFSRRHRLAHPTQPIYILKYAIGGTNLGHTVGTDWLPSEGELFNSLKTELDALKADIVTGGDTPVVEAIIGFQGEADASIVDGGAQAAAYQVNKSAFYAAARADWGDGNTRFIDARISTLARSPTLTYAAAVRRGQLLAAANEQDALLVNTDDLPLGVDSLHFDAESIQAIGARFFQAYETSDPTVLVSQEIAVPSSNRLQVTSVAEVTLGTTPTTPRMRTRRLTAESLFHRPTFVDQAELRADRMVGDPIITGTEDGGGINFDFFLPVAGGPLDTDIASAFYNSWNNTASRDNDGTADSVITDVATATQIVTFTTGAQFRAGHLVRFTGFTNSANNGIFRVSLGGTTTSTFASSGLVDEPAPPATARMKVVGCRGTNGDITATATGLGSTALNFSNMDLFVGQWIKIGGTAAGERFATAALNGYARITAIAATALTLDHRPTGWTTDAGAAKTITFYTSDYIYNGTTQLGQTIEKGFLGQTTPVYIVNKGMVATQFSMNFEAKQKVSGSVTYMGMSGSESTTSLDASPDAASALANYPVFAASANVGGVYEAGVPLASPDCVRALTFTINNNITPIECVDSIGPGGLTGHECTITGQVRTYFGTDTLLAKFYAGTASSIAIRASKSGAGAGTSGTQAFVLNLPRVTYNGDGSPMASGKNTDLDLPLSFSAAKDEATTNAMITLSRFEYLEP